MRFLDCDEFEEVWILLLLFCYILQKKRSRNWIPCVATTYESRLSKNRLNSTQTKCYDMEVEAFLWFWRVYVWVCIHICFRLSIQCSLVSSFSATQNPNCIKETENKFQFQKFPYLIQLCSSLVSFVSLF